MPTTDLVPATTTTKTVARFQEASGAEDFMALSMPVASYMETLKENTGSTNFTRDMLDRIKFPSGDTIFTVKNILAGVEDELPQLDVILLAIQPNRTLWAGSYDPNNTEPPVCRSYDGEVGVGEYGINSAENPSGMCSTCPMSAWGSAQGGKGKGQACQLKHDIYFLMPGVMTPSIMTLPVTSGKPLKEFRAALTKSGIPLFGCVVTIKANKVKNTPYSVATFALKHTLPLEEATMLRSYAQNVKTHLIAAQAQDDMDEANEASAVNTGTTVDAVEASAPATELPF